MTLKEFLKECEGLKEMFTWNNTNKILRGKRKGADDDYCPITAMCYMKTGRDLPKCLFGKAAKELGLDAVIAGNIVEASDLIFKNKPPLYAELVKALGLK